MTDVSRRRWFGLVFISLAVALIIVDSTIVNVAIPSIVDDLKITSTQVQWVQEAYTRVFASLLLLFGSRADRVGRRRLLLIGVVLFTGHERPDLQHPFFLEVLVGLKHSIGDLGYDLLLFSSERPGCPVSGSGSVPDNVRPIAARRPPTS